MHQAAALLAAALVFSLAACGGGEAPPTPYFPSQAEMEAQATAQAEHNRTVSATAKAMTQATVEASIGSEKTGNVPSTAPPAKTPQPATAPAPTETATPAHPAATVQTPPPGGATAAPLNPAQYAGKLYDCLRSNKSAKAMFVQPALPPETADSRVRQEYETLTALTMKSRNSFVQSYSTLIAENPAAGPILALAQSLCEALPDSR